MLILRCESVVILLSAVISKVINLASVINNFCLYMKQKDPVWLLYSALDEQKTSDNKVPGLKCKSQC